MRVAFVSLLIASMTVAPAGSQTPAPDATAPGAVPAAPPAPASPGRCDAAEFRQFDYWVGDWVVTHISGREVGRNSIQLEQKGCVAVERWTSIDGGTGVSMNFYDTVARAWTQVWISPGIVLTMKGGLVDGAMVLEGPLHYVKDGRATLLRGTWTPLPDGRVRQHFVESADQGKIWVDWFDGYYSRL